MILYNVVESHTHTTCKDRVEERLVPAEGLLFNPRLVKPWPGIGNLELSHSLEYLPVGGLLPNDEYPADLVTAGKNGNHFLDLCRLTRLKKKYGNPRTRTCCARLPGKGSCLRCFVDRVCSCQDLV